MNALGRFSILCCMVVVGFGVRAGAQARRGQGAYAQITAACRNAGFVQGGAASGTGLQLDCVQPIMQGIAAPAKASKPLPKVGADVIAACKAQNPEFGQGRPGRSGGTRTCHPGAAAARAGVAGSSGRAG